VGCSTLWSSAMLFIAYLFMCDVLRGVPVQCWVNGELLSCHRVAASRWSRGACQLEVNGSGDAWAAAQAVTIHDYSFRGVVAMCGYRKDEWVARCALPSPVLCACAVTHPVLRACVVTHPVLCACVVTHPVLCASAVTHPVLCACVVTHPVLCTCVVTHPVLCACYVTHPVCEPRSALKGRPRYIAVLMK
jgi:hypothetical protein